MKELECEGGVTLLDDEDYDLYSAVSAPWRIENGYAMQMAKRDHGRIGPVLLHRLVVDAPSGKHVHHKDGNPLNNTRANLEIKTRTEHLRDHWEERRERAGLPKREKPWQRVRVWDEAPPVPWAVIDAERNARVREQQR